MEQNLNKHYIKRFLVICIPVLIVMAFLPFPPIFNVVVMGGVAFYVGKLFAKDNARAPVPSEHNRFAAICFATVAGLSLILLGLSLLIMTPEDKAVFFAGFEGRSISAFFVAIPIAVLMMWGTIHACFGLGARLYMKKLTNEGPRV